MKIKSVFEDAFLPYGKVLTGFNFYPLIKALVDNTSLPKKGVTYVPSEASLEDLSIFSELQNHLYGGMPIQIGYCNGSNQKLNCLEYHRGSEVNIMADDVILLLAPLQKLKDGVIHVKAVDGFFVPKGTAVQLYETTLHYAPCTAPIGTGFRTAIVLPRGTNTEKPLLSLDTFEDKLLRAKNKWLIAHPDSSEAKDGAFVGLVGENISIERREKHV